MSMINTFYWCVITGSLSFMVGANQASNNERKFLIEQGVRLHIIDCPVEVVK